MDQSLLRMLPSVDELMSSPELVRQAELHDRNVVVDAARAVLGRIRQEIIDHDEARSVDDITPERISVEIARFIDRKFSPSLRRVINATGVILHTGLGRSVLPEEAVRAVESVIGGYCNLAADLEAGQRMSRDEHTTGLLCEITGAEASTIVNNNAAATVLVLNTLARGKNVIVSRGQLVEIGGSFRMPEVMEVSGATLREVGTTNKTHLRDYETAIDENTGAILKVHQSNFKIVGFTEEPSIHELVELGRKHNIPVIDDIGGGALIDLREFGLGKEPMVQESIAAGAGAVCFSGDKLIGGPQAGVIVGRESIIREIKKNPLARALRIGKMEVAAMEATLRLFLDRATLASTNPTYRMFSLTPESIARRARSVMRRVKAVVGELGDFEVISGESRVGSGTSPTEMIPTRLLSIKPANISAGELARRLRRAEPPVFVRIQEGAVLFDFRTVQPTEDRVLVDLLIQILGEVSSREL